MTPWVCSKDGYEMLTEVRFPHACALATSIPSAASGDTFWSCEALQVRVTMRGGLGHSDRFDARYEVESTDTEAVLLRDHIRVLSALGVDWAWAGPGPPPDEVADRLRFTPAAYEVGVVLGGGFRVGMVTNDDNVVDDFADAAANGYAMVRGERLVAGTRTGFETYRAPTVETSYTVDLGKVSIMLCPQPTASDLFSGGSSASADDGERSPLDNALRAAQLRVSGSYVFHRPGRPGGYGAPDCATTLVMVEGLRALVDRRVLGALGPLISNYFGAVSFAVSTGRYWAEADDRGLRGWNLGVKHSMERAAVLAAEARAADPAVPRPNKFETMLRVVLADCAADLPEFKDVAASAEDGDSTRNLRWIRAFTREAVVEMRGVGTYSDLTVTVDPVSIRFPRQMDAAHCGGVAGGTVAYMRVDGVEFHSHTYAGPPPLFAGYRSFSSLRIGSFAGTLEAPALLSLLRWASNLAPPPPPYGPGGAPPGRFWRRHRMYNTLQATVGPIQIMLRGHCSLTEVRADEGFQVQTDNRVLPEGHSFARLTLPALSVTVNAVKGGYCDCSGGGGGNTIEANEVARLECRLEVLYRENFTTYQRDEQEQTGALRDGDRETHRIPPEFFLGLSGGAGGRDSVRGTPIARSISGISLAQSDMGDSEACHTVPTFTAISVGVGGRDFIAGGGGGEEDPSSTSQEFHTASAGYCTATEGELSDEDCDDEGKAAAGFIGNTAGGPRLRRRLLQSKAVALHWGDEQYPLLSKPTKARNPNPSEANSGDVPEDDEEAFLSGYWCNSLFAEDWNSESSNTDGPLSPASATSSCGGVGYVDGDGGEDNAKEDWRRGCTDVVFHAVRAVVCPHALEAVLGWLKEGPMPSWTAEGCLAHISSSLPPPPPPPSFAFPNQHRVSAVTRFRAHCIQLLLLEQPAAAGQTVRAAGLAIGCVMVTTESVTWHPGCPVAHSNAPVPVEGHLVPRPTAVVEESGMLDTSLGRFSLWTGAIEPKDMFVRGGVDGDEVKRTMGNSGFAPPQALGGTSSGWRLRISALAVGTSSSEAAANLPKRGHSLAGRGAAVRLHIARRGAIGAAAGAASAEAAAVRVLATTDAPLDAAPVILLLFTLAGDLSETLAQRRRIMQRNVAIVLDQAAPQMLRVGRARSQSLGACPCPVYDRNCSVASLPRVALLRRSRSEEPAGTIGFTVSSRGRTRPSLPELRRGQSDDAGRASWRVEARWHVWLLRRYLRECSSADLNELHACLRLPEPWTFVSRHSWARLGSGDNIGGREGSRLAGGCGRLSIGHVEVEIRRVARCGDDKVGGSGACTARLYGVQMQSAMKNRVGRHMNGEPNRADHLHESGGSGQADIAAWGNMGQIEVDCIPDVLVFVNHLFNSLGPTERAKAKAARIAVHAAFSQTPRPARALNCPEANKAVSFAPVRQVYGPAFANGTAASDFTTTSHEPVVISAGHEGEGAGGNGTTCVLLPLRGVLKRVELGPVQGDGNLVSRGPGISDGGSEAVCFVEPEVALALASEMAAAADGGSNSSTRSLRRTISLPSHAALRAAKSEHLSSRRLVNGGSSHESKVFEKYSGGNASRPAEADTTLRPRLRVHLQASLSGQIRLRAPGRGTVELELTRGLISYTRSQARVNASSETTKTRPAVHETACISVLKASSRLLGPNSDPSLTGGAVDAWASVMLEDLRVIGSRTVRPGIVPKIVALRSSSVEGDFQQGKKRYSGKGYSGEKVNFVWSDGEPDATEGEHEFRTVVRSSQYLYDFLL